jgi:hypothetical protein
MKSLSHFTSIAIVLITSLSVQLCNAQADVANASPENLAKNILYHDSIFWAAYDACDVEKMSAYFTDDIEFYHDKNGLTTPKLKLDEATRTGLCGNPNWHLRREAIEGTIKVFPMDNFGALISGEHLFYINETGKKEYLDGYGKFTHLWKFADNTWKMSRVISYDHGPPPFINKRKEMVLEVRELHRLTGKYKSSRGETATITAGNNSLTIAMGNFQIQLVPESKTKFFARDRDLQIGFVLQENEVNNLVVYERGNVVDELVRQ